MLSLFENLLYEIQIVELIAIGSRSKNIEAYRRLVESVIGLK